MFDSYVITWCCFWCCLLIQYFNSSKMLSRVAQRVSKRNERKSDRTNRWSNELLIWLVTLYSWFEAIVKLDIDCTIELIDFALGLSPNLCCHSCVAANSLNERWSSWANLLTNANGFIVRYSRCHRSCIGSTYARCSSVIFQSTSELYIHPFNCPLFLLMIKYSLFIAGISSSSTASNFQFYTNKHEAMRSTRNI